MQSLVFLTDFVSKVIEEKTLRGRLDPLVQEELSLHLKGITLNIYFD